VAYGQDDLKSVVASAAARAEAGAANQGYHQAQVPGADHFFDGQDQALVDVVVQWLNEVVTAP
jgi:alpha/beta superfamily hydrolase